MVCISCIVIPVFLWLWHKYLQPIFLKFYNPWAKVDAQTDDKGEVTAGADGIIDESSGSKTDCETEQLVTVGDKKTD